MAVCGAHVAYRAWLVRIGHTVSPSRGPAEEDGLDMELRFSGPHGHYEGFRPTYGVDWCTHFTLFILMHRSPHNAQLHPRFLLRIAGWLLGCFVCY